MEAVNDTQSPMHAFALYVLYLVWSMVYGQLDVENIKLVDIV